MVGWCNRPGFVKCHRCLHQRRRAWWNGTSFGAKDGKEERGERERCFKSGFVIAMKKSI